MRSDQLEQALTGFIEEASQYLQSELSSGAEIPFELASSSSRGGLRTPLYSYRPLTANFLAERSSALRALDSHSSAVALMVGAQGLERYLHSRAVNHIPVTDLKRSEAALIALLGDVFAEQSDFEVHPQRMRLALDALGQSTEIRRDELTLLASLHGLTLSSAKLQLTRGLSLVQPQTLRGAPEQMGILDESQPHLFVLFTSNDPDVQGAITQGREVLEDLLRALRLFGDGRLALGELAWTRVDGGSWGPLALGGRGRPHGVLVITPDQEDELRAFCNLVSRRAPHGNELAWVLERFELGCERTEPQQALSDYLMALRVLLCDEEPENELEELIARRLAALCATSEHRGALADRVLQAHALERDVIRGEATENAATTDLVSTIGDHLRALLRDVICGHLDPGLTLLAEELISCDEAQPEPAEEKNEIAQALGISEEEPQITVQSLRASGEQSQESLWSAQAEEPVGAPV